MKKYFVVIDVTGLPDAIVELWKRTAFLRKLEQLTGEYCFFDANQRTAFASMSVIKSLTEVAQVGVSKNARGIILLEGTQVLVLQRCIKKIIDYNNDFDYFTQWEHCRLPIGLGARAFSLKTLETVTAEQPSQLINGVLQQPHKYKVVYDDEKYVDYATAHLDGRVGDAAVIGDCKTDSDEQILALLRNGKGFPQYQPASLSGPMDERKMKAAYGFETEACAEFPTYIMFDITNRCNARCLHCPQSTDYGRGVHKTIHLDFSLYTRAVDECRGREIQFIRLTADGEPLLHPKVFDMIDYAVKKDVGPVGLTTNGSLLNLDCAEKLAKSGAFLVDISLDAACKETYEKIRRGLSFEKTVGNIHHLLELRSKFKSPLKVMVSFVKQQHNIDELDKFIAHWESLVDKVLVREMISNVNMTPVASQEPINAAIRWPCPHWFRRIVINYEGVIKACPVDWNNATAYRPLSETTLFDAWHSDFYWRNRLEHLNNDFSQGSPCKNCRDWQGSPWNLGYEKVIGMLKTTAQ